MRRRIYRKIGKRKHVRHSARALARHNADPRHELVKRKGLDEVVVRAGVKSPHAVRHTVHGREQDNGRIDSGAAHPAQKLHAVHARHHHIQDHRVISHAREILQRLHPVKAGVGTVPLGGKRFYKNTVEIALVLHDQHAHRITSITE